MCWSLKNARSSRFLTLTNPKISLGIEMLHRRRLIARKPIVAIIKHTGEKSKSRRKKTRRYQCTTRRIKHSRQATRECITTSVTKMIIDNGVSILITRIMIKKNLPINYKRSNFGSNCLFTIFIDTDALRRWRASKCFITTMLPIIHHYLSSNFRPEVVFQLYPLIRLI